jgi:hypothetical protein
MQMDLGDGSDKGQPYVAQFRALWTEALRGFRRARPGDFRPAPELLSTRIFYARVFRGVPHRARTLR